MSAPPRFLRRHLEGWPLGLWIVTVAGLTAALVVPRPVAPELVPPPIIDRLEQRALIELESQRAARARAGLPLDVRSVGEAFRRYGRATYENPAIAPQVGAQLRRLAAAALEREGPERLLELRALQAELFAAALRESPATLAPAAIELGGGLLQRGLGRGWFDAPPAGADGRELGTLFRIYWAEALGLGQKHPVSATLNEWRAQYRFLLARPLLEGADREGDLRRKLEYVAALAKHDQEYPAHLARGVLLYQRGAPAEAAGELRLHLTRFPDGPWTLRARNHLAACGALLIE